MVNYAPLLLANLAAGLLQGREEKRQQSQTEALNAFKMFGSRAMSPQWFRTMGIGQDKRSGWSDMRGELEAQEQLGALSKMLAPHELYGTEQGRGLAEQAYGLKWPSQRETTSEPLSGGLLGPGQPEDRDSPVVPTDPNYVKVLLEQVRQQGRGKTWDSWLIDTISQLPLESQASIIGNAITKRTMPSAEQEALGVPSLRGPAVARAAGEMPSANALLGAQTSRGNAQLAANTALTTTGARISQSEAEFGRTYTKVLADLENKRLSGAAATIAQTAKMQIDSIKATIDQTTDEPTRAAKLNQMISVQNEANRKIAQVNERKVRLGSKGLKRQVTQPAPKASQPKLTADQQLLNWMKGLKQ